MNARLSPLSLGMAAAALSVLSALLLVLSACGEGSNPAAPNPSTSQSPGSTDTASPRDRIFRFVSGTDHHTLDPQKMTWLHDIRVAQGLYETLVRFRVPSLELEPGVAESWDVSPDGLTYSFHLRKDAKWSNGDPVAASDFIYAWRRALLPDTAVQYSEMFFHIAGAREFFQWRTEQLAFPARAKFADSQAHAQWTRDAWKEAIAKFDQTVGLSAPDPQTLVVKLDHPAPYFLELCAFEIFSPVHPASVEKVTAIDPVSGRISEDAAYWEDPARLVTNGPYRLEQRRFKRDLLMTPNPNWWNRKAIANDGVLELIIDENPQTALLAYKGGQADWLPDIPTASPLAADLAAEKRGDVFLIPWAGTYFYTFNCLPKLPDGRDNPLTDARVRRALSMAIDRKVIVSQVTRLNQPIALSFIPPEALPGYEPPVNKGAAFDVEAAKRLLAEAGYSKDKPLKGLSILYNTGAGHETIAQMVKWSWEHHLSVSVTLEGVESRNVGERLKSHNFFIARSSWLGDYRDPTAFLVKFLGDNPNNNSGWKDAKFDELYSQAEHEPDAAKRSVMLRDAEAILLGNQPMSPFFHYVTLHVYDPKKVQGLAPNMWNHYRLEQVSVQR